MSQEFRDTRAHERINSIEGILIDMKKTQEAQAKALEENTVITKRNGEVVDAIFETMQAFRWFNNVVVWFAKKIFKIVIWVTPIVTIWITLKDHFRN